MSDTTPRERTRSRSALVGLPTFRQPTPEPSTSEPSIPEPEFRRPETFPHRPDILPPLTEGAPTASLRSDVDSDGRTRTGILGTRVATVAEQKAAGKLVGGVSKLLIVLGDIVLGRAGRKIRRPTDEQMLEFSSAIGEILTRRVDIAKVGPDIMALTTAGGAFGDWASDGPMTYVKGPTVDHVGYVPPEPDPFTIEPQGPQFAEPPKTSTFANADSAPPVVQFLP